MGAIRAAAVLAGFVALTVPLIPVQDVLLRLGSRRARRLPHWYHRRLCGLLGVRIRLEGQVERARPALLVSNHTSWLDIPVLSAVAPVSFVAKKEIGSWPGVATLARLQRTIYVDREKRSDVTETANEIVSRLEGGDAIVLFAEGTSSDGNRVLPFRSSLFAAVKPSSRLKAEPVSAVVQTVSIVYTHLAGLPVGRLERPVIGWYGDMEMTSHAWDLLKRGPIDVTVRVGTPTPLHEFADRKQLASKTERDVREHVVRVLRGRSPDEPLELAAVTAPAPRPAREPVAGTFR